MDFLAKLAGLISQLSAGNLKLRPSPGRSGPRGHPRLRRRSEPVRKCQPQGRAIVRVPREELLKYGLERFYSPPQSNGHSIDNSIREHIQRALNGEELVFERAIHTQEGKDLCCEVRMVRLPSANTGGCEPVFIDITERNRDPGGDGKGETTAGNRLHRRRSGLVGMGYCQPTGSNVPISSIQCSVTNPGTFLKQFRPGKTPFIRRSAPGNSLITAHLKTGTAYDVEYRMRKADGTYVWWHDIGTAQRDPTGKAVIMSGACIDITEKKTVRGGVAEKRGSFSPHHGTIAVQRPGDFSPKKSYLAKQCISAIMGSEERSHGRLQHPERPADGRAWGNAHRPKGIRGRTGNNPAVDYDAKAALGTGNRRIVQGDFYPIRDEVGIIRNIILIHQDITDRKRAEGSPADLGIVSEQYHPTKVLTRCGSSDERGTMLLLNQACRDLLNISNEDVVGR